MADGSMKAKNSPAKGKAFQRFNRVGILPDIPVNIPDPKLKSKTLDDVRQSFEWNQRIEVDDICTGLQLRLEHVKKALPIPKCINMQEVDNEEQTPLEKRILEEIAIEQEEIEEELTPIDKMSIALEVCHDEFPRIGKEMNDYAGALVNAEFTQILHRIVEIIENCLHEKVLKDRIVRQTQHEVRSPEKASPLKQTSPSPRAQLQKLKHHFQQHIPPLDSPRQHENSKPFELESLLHKEKVPAQSSDVVQRDNTFREVLKCREFPPTKVPREEYIQKEYSYCPIEARYDMQSVHINVVESKTRQDTWVVTEFPKTRPRLNTEQVGFLTQWQAMRYKQVEEKHKALTDSNEILHLYLDYTDSVMYEMCRLLFDKCPTSSNMLYGLWHFFFSIVAFINKSIEEELTVLKQTIRCLKVEVDQFKSKIGKQAEVVDAMRMKLTQKSKIIAFEREKCIMERNLLNRYLASDQTLVRLTLTFIDAIRSLLPDKESNLGPTVMAPHHFSCTEVLNEMHRALKLKFAASQSETQPVSKRSQRMHRLSTVNLNQNVMESNSSMLTNYDVDSMTGEVDAAEKRLSQLLTLSSPDCLLGWDAQAVWQHAFFIPPVDEVMEMEYRVRHMVLRVERSIANRGSIRRRSNRGTQTMESSQAAQKPPKSHAALISLRAVKIATDFCRPQGNTEKGDTTTSHTKSYPLRRMAEMKQLVPISFQPFVHRLSASYTCHDYSVNTLSRIVTLLSNQLIGQLSSAVNVHSETPKAAMPREMFELAPTKAIYRIFLARFRVPLFANERLMDVLTSLSHLDTQSDKLHIWCRMLHLTGVEPLPHAAFWFVLHTLHVLAKCSHDGYYLCESDEVEYVSQQPAWDALAIVFAPFPAEVFQRCKSKLIGLAQIYGAMWIPIYSIVTMCVDEWEARYVAIKLEMETYFSNAIKVDSLSTFDQVVRSFAPAAHTYGIASAYTLAIQKSCSTRLRPIDCTMACIERGIVPPNAAAQFDKSILMFSVPSDAMHLKTRELSMMYLRVVWSTTRDQITKVLESHEHPTNSVGIRLVAPLNHAMQEEPPQTITCWHLFEQLVSLAYSTRRPSIT